jgi:hypothetical protein
MNSPNKSPNSIHNSSPQPLLARKSSNLPQDNLKSQTEASPSPQILQKLPSLSVKKSQLKPMHSPEESAPIRQSLPVHKSFSKAVVQVKELATKTPEPVFNKRPISDQSLAAIEVVVVGKDDHSRGKDVLLLRPATKKEMAEINKKKNKSKTANKAKPTGKPSSPPSKTRSREELLRDLMPTPHEIAGYRGQDELSRLLTKISSHDSFVKRSNTQAYRELLESHGMTEEQLSKYLMVDKSFEDIKNSFLEMPDPQLVDFLANPLIRLEVVNSMLKSKQICQVKTGCLDADGCLEWQPILHIVAKSPTFFDLLIDEVCTFMAGNLGLDGCKKLFNRVPYFKSPELLLLIFKSDLNKSFIRANQPEIEAISKKCSLGDLTINICDLLLREKFELVAQAILNYPDDNENKLTDEDKKSKLSGLIKEHIKIELQETDLDGLLKDDFRRFIADVVATAVQSSAALQQEVIDSVKEKVRHRDHPNLLAMVYSLPKDQRNKLRSECSTLETNFPVLQKLDKITMASEVGKLSREQLVKVVDGLPAAIIVEHEIEKAMKNLALNDVKNKSEKLFKPDAKQQPAAKTTSFDDFDTDLAEMDCNCSDHLEEADPSIIQDFWPFRSNGDGLASLPHSIVIGKSSKLVSLPCPYSLMLSSSPFLDFPDGCSIVEASTGKIVKHLAGVYFAFVDAEGLVTLRITDCGTSVFGTQREVVVYDVDKLPELSEKRRYFCNAPIRDLHDEARIAACYSSACMAELEEVKAVYGYSTEKARAVVFRDGQYDDVDLIIDAGGETSLSSMICFYDNCEHLAAVTHGSLLMFDVDISFDDEVGIVKLSATLKFRVNSGERFIRLDCNTCDPVRMACAKLPHALYSQSRIFRPEHDDGSYMPVVTNLQTLLNLTVVGSIVVAVAGRSPKYLAIQKLQDSEDSKPYSLKLPTRGISAMADGRLLMLQRQDTAMVVCMDSNFEKEPDRTQINIDEKQLGVSGDLYWYYGEGKLTIKRMKDHAEHASLSTEAINAKYSLSEKEAKLAGVIADSGSRFVLVAIERLRPRKDEDRYWVFRVDLDDLNLQRIDISAKNEVKLKTVDRYLILEFMQEGQMEDEETRLSTSVYYFDEDGLLRNFGEFPYHLSSRSTEALNGFSLSLNAKSLEHSNPTEIARSLPPDARLCHVPPSAHVIGWHTVYCLSIVDPDLESTLTFNVEGIHRAAMDPINLVAYAVMRNKQFHFSLNKLTLHSSDGSCDVLAVLDLDLSRYDLLELQLNSDCSCLMVIAADDDSDKKLAKVLCTKSLEVLFSIDPALIGFSKSKRVAGWMFDACSLTLVNVMYSHADFQSLDFEDSYRQQKQSVFRLALLSYLDALQETGDNREDSFHNIGLFLDSTTPIRLAREKSLLVLFANIKNTELLDLYIEKCSLKRLVLHGHLIEWMFSNYEQGKTIRKLVADKLEETFCFSAVHHETLDPQVFDKVVSYRYTAKLLQEPSARKIFLGLLRTPLVGIGSANQEPITMEIADEKLDKDYGMCHYLKIDPDNGHLFRRQLVTQVREVKTKLGKIKGNNLKRYQLYVSSTPVQLSIGHQVCTDLFKLLDQCPAEELNDLIRPVIYREWRNIFPFAFGYMVTYMVFASLCYAFFGFLFKNTGIGISIIVLSSLLLIFELLSLRAHRQKYLKSPWNTVDLLALLGSIVLVPMMWSFDVETPGWAVGRCAIMVVVWIRALTWLRVFRAVRHLITMVLRVFYDMIAFLVVLAVAILGLTFVWRLSFYFPGYDGANITESSDQIPTFFSSLQIVTMIILGNMPGSEANGTEFSVVRFIVAVVFGIILSLALTNFLIAIISGTYEDIEATKDVHDLREVIGLIVDFNGALTGLCACKFFENKEYLLSIHVKEDTEDEVISCY